MTKIAQLQALEQAMLGGAWRTVGVGPILEIESSLLHPDGCEIGVGDDLRQDDAFGIVALRNASPQLLALWAACEAERDAVCTHIVVRAPSTDLGFYGCGDDEDPNHDDACPVAIARAAVSAVLAKGLP